VTCFDGLVEEKHPYGFIAFNVCKDLIEDEVKMINILVISIEVNITASQAGMAFKNCANFFK
jgi:hypothetical protein